MIEHNPWEGPLYCKGGIGGQKIAIVGHSHHLQPPERDHANFTVNLLKDWREWPDWGKKFNQNSFFPPIPKYFDQEIRADFWDRVLFFNYLPNSVGTTDERYNSGSDEQYENAKPRFLKIIAKYRPHKVLVFTKKGWPKFPPTREEESSQKSCFRLEPQELRCFEWGTYDAGGHIVMAFGLRHPQGAGGQLMQDAVQHILGMPPATS